MKHDQARHEKIAEYGLGPMEFDVVVLITATVAGEGRRIRVDAGASSSVRPGKGSPELARLLARKLRLMAAQMDGGS